MFNVETRYYYTSCGIDYYRVYLDGEFIFVGTLEDVDDYLYILEEINEEHSYL